MVEWFGLYGLANGVYGMDVVRGSVPPALFGPHQESHGLQPTSQFLWTLEAMIFFTWTKYIKLCPRTLTAKQLKKLG
jgi:hypothetical protein